MSTDIFANPAPAAPASTPAPASAPDAQPAPAAAAPAAAPAPSGEPAAPAKTTLATADVFEATIPDGSFVTKELAEDFSKFVLDKKLDPAVAKELWEKKVSVIDSVITSKQQSFEKLAFDEWPKLVQQDKELGGANFEKTKKLAATVVNKFAPPGLKKFLNDTGYGNHIDLVRFCVKIGEAMSDDKVVTGQVPESGPKRPEDILFGA